MVVKKASSVLRENLPFGGYNVAYDGELTLSGVLYLYPKGEYATFVSGDLLFYPDPTRSDAIPLLSSMMEENEFAIGEDGNKAYISGKTITVGNIDTCKIDLSDIISEDEYVRVKIKIDNIFEWLGDSSGHGYGARLVSVEKL